MFGTVLPNKVRGYSNIKILLTSEPLYKNGISPDQEKALQHCLIKGLEIIKGLYGRDKKKQLHNTKKKIIFVFSI